MWHMHIRRGKLEQVWSQEEHVERVIAMEELFERNYIRGYHVYKEGGWRGIGVWKGAQKRFWSICCGCKKEGTIIGHLPWKVLRMCWLFLRRGGTIECNSNWAQETFSWPGTRWTWSFLLSTAWKFWNFRTKINLTNYFLQQIFLQWIIKTLWCEL